MRFEADDPPVDEERVDDDGCAKREELDSGCSKMVWANGML